MRAHKRTRTGTCAHAFERLRPLRRFPNLLQAPLNFAEPSRAPGSSAGLAESLAQSRADQCFCPCVRL
eukprot:15467855-Alexandrium_andersonii.AAC.1